VAGLAMCFQMLALRTLDLKNKWNRKKLEKPKTGERNAFDRNSATTTTPEIRQQRRKYEHKLESVMSANAELLRTYP